MAIAIKAVPTLTNEVAERFEEISEANLMNAGKLDFSVEKEMARAIVAKSKL